jgi:hypothetical protein
VIDLLELQRYAGGQLPGWNGMAAFETWLDDPVSGAEVMQVLVAAGLAHSGSWSGGSGNEYAIGTVFGESRRWRRGERMPSARRRMMRCLR